MEKNLSTDEKKKGIAVWNKDIIDYIKIKWNIDKIELGKKLGCTKENIYSKYDKYVYFTPEQARILYTTFNIPFEKIYLGTGSMQRSIYASIDSEFSVAEPAGIYSTGKIQVLENEINTLKSQILDKDKIINLLELEKKGK